MPETKTVPTLEREYIIPLRNEWRKVASYRRAGKAVKAIKKFIAKHMKVLERDLSKVKLDVYLNQEIWFRGRRKPPAKIKVKAKKEGEIVKVSLAEMPKEWQFAKQKLEKRHKKAEKIEEKKEEVQKPAEKTEEKKEVPAEKPAEPSIEEEKKKAETEKEKAVAETRALEAKQEAKIQKHVTKTKEQVIHRMALKK